VSDLIAEAKAERAAGTAAEAAAVKTTPTA
jgi:hypothetical protein